MKSATTIDQQLDLLKSRGLTVANMDKAREILLDIGYYRLGFYLFPFEKSYPDLRDRTHEYIDGATFESYMHTIRQVRNACAHGLLLYDIRLIRRINRGPARQTPQESGNIVGALRVTKYIMEQVSLNRATELSASIKSLYEKLCVQSPILKPLIADLSTI